MKEFMSLARHMLDGDLCVEIEHTPRYSAVHLCRVHHRADGGSDRRTVGLVIFDLTESRRVVVAESSADEARRVAPAGTWPEPLPEGDGMTWEGNWWRVMETGRDGHTVAVTGFGLAGLVPAWAIEALLGLGIAHG